MTLSFSYNALYFWKIIIVIENRLCTCFYGWLNRWIFILIILHRLRINFTYGTLFIFLGFVQFLVFIGWTMFENRTYFVKFVFTLFPYNLSNCLYSSNSKKSMLSISPSPYPSRPQINDDVLTTLPSVSIIFQFPPHFSMLPMILTLL